MAQRCARAGRQQELASTNNFEIRKHEHKFFFIFKFFAKYQIYVFSAFIFLLKSCLRGFSNKMIS